MTPTLVMKTKSYTVLQHTVTTMYTISKGYLLPKSVASLTKTLTSSCILNGTSLKCRSFHIYEVRCFKQCKITKVATTETVPHLAKIVHKHGKIIAWYLSVKYNGTCFLNCNILVMVFIWRQDNLLINPCWWWERLTKGLQVISKTSK